MGSRRMSSHNRPAADLKTDDERYVLWVFPKAAPTRALRFTHEAKPVDSRFAGWLGGAYVLGPRMTNVAPKGSGRDRRRRGSRDTH